VYVNYGLKADFQKIQKQDVSLNGTIVIFRAGKITLAEKVSSLSQSFTKLGSRKLHFLLLKTHLCASVQVCRSRVCRLVPAGLVLLVCTKPPYAGLDTKTERSWLPFMVAFFLASGTLAGTAKQLE